MHTQNDTLEGGFGSSFLDDKETAIRLQNRLNACFADLGEVERVKGLEPSTSTLARLHSTN